MREDVFRKWRSQINSTISFGRFSSVFSFGFSDGVSNAAAEDTDAGIT
jgi:hypothetical protein